MKKKNYDEYQNIKRQKTAYQALFITFALVLINGIILENYTWAQPMARSIIIIFLPTLYFVTRTVFQNAYLGNHVKNPFHQAMLFLALGLLDVCLSVTAYVNGTRYIADGMLLNNASTVLLGIFFVYISAVIFIKYWIDQRREGRGSE